LASPLSEATAVTDRVIVTLGQNKSLGYPAEALPRTTLLYETWVHNVSIITEICYFDIRCKENFKQRREK
jgi:hypothetical protein